MKRDELLTYFGGLGNQPSHHPGKWSFLTPYVLVPMIR